MDIWFAAGVRTPFTKIDGPLAALDAIELSVPVLTAILRPSGRPVRPDAIVWCAVIPTLAYSNIDREVLLDGELDPTIPAYSTIMACSTSIMAAINGAELLEPGTCNLVLAGGAENMIRV